MAQASKLDLDKYRACLADPTRRWPVEMDTREAKDRQVNATPTFFIGDARLVGNVFITDGAGPSKKNSGTTDEQTTSFLSIYFARAPPPDRERASYYAGFMKAVHPTAEFAAMISAYKLLPAQAVPVLALVLPYLEMWVGLFVMTGMFTRVGPAAAMGLFSVFLFALASALLRGIDLVSCGCFGADSLSPKTTLMMDRAAAVLYPLRIHQYPQPLTLDDFFPDFLHQQGRG